MWLTIGQTIIQTLISYVLYHHYFSFDNKIEMKVIKGHGEKMFVIWEPRFSLTRTMKDERSKRKAEEIQGYADSTNAKLFYSDVRTSD